ADRRELRTFKNIADLGHREVTVDVDHLDPPAADEHLPARGRRLDEQSSNGAGAGLHEISASGHGRSSLPQRTQRTRRFNPEPTGLFLRVLRVLRGGNYSDAP